ncbi:hypothetical protein [Ralstonia soli]|uniref:Uncharacterized protein n=1 Tax=Ralstonia soli TaxID=2953896 RepID=A0ABT1AE78_9RALS|nr:hypothetical protein [Ralstonia soli]MCO5396646.1 hypothetical protein [Ralstonia soli]
MDHSLFFGIKIIHLSGKRAARELGEDPCKYATPNQAFLGCMRWHGGDAIIESRWRLHDVSVVLIAACERIWPRCGIPVAAFDGRV